MIVRTICCGSNRTLRVAEREVEMDNKKTTEKRSVTSESKVTIKIPRQLYNNLKEIIRDSGFDSVTDFVVYVLRDIASSGVQGGEIGLTKREIDAVRSRLKSLGYL